MAKLSINAGATSEAVNIFLQDSSSTIGAGLSGLVYNTAGLTAYYALPKAAPVAITLATLASATAAYSSGGFFELDATHAKGLYRFDIPNAAIAAGRFVTIHFYGAANLAQCMLEIDLQSNTYTINGTAQTGRDLGASVLLSTGTGAGQLDFTSGVVKSNLVQILGTALSETAGLLAGGFKKFFNVASPTMTALGVDQTGDSYARLGAPASASLAQDIAAIRLDTNTTVPNLIAALNNLSAAGAKAQMVAALATDTYAEPAQGAPAATATLAVKINMIYKFMINLKKQTATDLKIYNAAGSVVDHKITSIADDGTTLTEPGVISGP